MVKLYFFLLLPVRIFLPLFLLFLFYFSDPGRKMNADSRGSGSTALVTATYFDY